MVVWLCCHEPYARSETLQLPLSCLEPLGTSPRTSRHGGFTMGVRKANPPFLNGVPELLILDLLSRRAMYGYELVQAIRAASGGSLEFGEGCVYPILHRLETQ